MELEKGPGIGREPFGGVLGWGGVYCRSDLELVHGLWVMGQAPLTPCFSPAPEAPPALGTLQVVHRGEHSLRLYWQPVPSAQGYRLRWRPEGERFPSRGLGMGKEGREQGIVKISESKQGQPMWEFHGVS